MLLNQQHPPVPQRPQHRQWRWRQTSTSYAISLCHIATASNQNEKAQDMSTTLMCPGLDVCFFFISSFFLWVLGTTTNNNGYETTNDKRMGPRPEWHIACRLGPGTLHSPFFFFYPTNFHFIFILGTMSLWKLGVGMTNDGQRWEDEWQGEQGPNDTRHVIWALFIRKSHHYLKHS